MLDPSAKLVDFAPGGVDLALRYGSGDWPGAKSQPLLKAPIVIVAAPVLLGGRRDLSPQELAELPWLEELGTTEATTWLAGRGVEHSEVAGRIQLPGNLLLDGVRAGQGVTVTVRHFVRRDIESGALIELYQEPGGGGYHIVTGLEPQRPAVRTFIRWLPQAG